MRLIRAFAAWMDRDWDGRNYNPIFAFAQRLLWIAPLIAALVLMGLLETLGVSRESLAVTALLVCGALGTLALVGLSLYRWVTGYSRSERQDQAARDYRANPVRSWRRFLSGR
jgi:hypothetical protein